MNRAPVKKKSTTLTSHRWPMAAQLVWEVYSKPGMNQRELGDAVKLKYFNANKRLSKLVKRCGGLVRQYVSKKDGFVRYKPAYRMTANEAREWVKQSKPGDTYE